MTKRFAAVFMIMLGCFACGDKPSRTYELKPEFNICDQWHDNMTWSEFLAVRNKLERPELIKYVDKIEQQKIAKEHGIAVPKTYIATRKKDPIISIITPLTSYVAKVTHMSFSEGLMIVKNGVDTITGKAVTPQQVQDHLFAFLDKKPRQVESWALHNVSPGFMVQEYIAERREVKIQTIWGKAVIGEWRGGEEQRATTPVWGRYDRDGNRSDGTEPSPSWWPKAIAAAEKVAAQSDALRVDFLVRDNDELLLNEIEIWPESQWTSKEGEIEKQLNDGYRAYCK